MMRAARVFLVLLAGALVAAAGASGQLAAWGDAHAADRPGGEALAAALHRWDDLCAPVSHGRDWLHDRSREVVEQTF